VLRDTLARQRNVIVRKVEGCPLSDTHEFVTEALRDVGVEIPQGTRFIRLGKPDGPIKAICRSSTDAVLLLHSINLRHGEGEGITHMKAYKDLNPQQLADKAARRQQNQVWLDLKAKGYKLTWVDGTQLYYLEPGAHSWAPAYPPPPAAIARD